jgi:hypothetical protein
MAALYRELHFFTPVLKHRTSLSHFHLLFDFPANNKPAKNIERISSQDEALLFSRDDMIRLQM